MGFSREESGAITGFTGIMSVWGFAILIRKTDPRMATKIGSKHHDSLKKWEFCEIVFYNK